MQRRIFLKSLGLGAVALSLVQRTASGARDSNKPNIIYILADDLGYGDLSSYGQQKFRTPNIDRLGSEGMKFTQHYSGSTVCAPSRCSLMTGRHTGHCQIRGNMKYKPIGQHPLKEGTVTIGTVLKKAGYATGMYGKWGLGAAGNIGYPGNLGFDEFVGYYCQANAHTYYPQYIWQNEKKIMLDGKTYSHDIIVEKALEFIKANKDKPFFCYMPVTIPHASMHAPPEKHAEWCKKFPQFNNKIGKYSGPNVKNPIAGFAAMVTHLDDQVGTLLKLLKDLGIDDSTLVMFTSDNGPHKEGGHNPSFWNSNGPLTGIKRDLYEGGIRVPMLARWPGKIKPGSVTDHISAFWDILPTAAELTGMKAPADIDGISMVSTFLGNAANQKQHEYLYWEFHEKGGKQAIRKGKWKAVRLNVGKNRNAAIQLFNLENDIGEKKNVAKSNPDVVKEMAKLMKTARTESAMFKFEKK